MGIKSKQSDKGWQKLWQIDFQFTKLPKLFYHQSFSPYKIFKPIFVLAYGCISMSATYVCTYVGYLILICSYFVTFVFTETKRPEIKDLCKHVLPLYADQWETIGIFLDIQPVELKVINSDNPKNTKGCCRNLFIKWLEGTRNVTWENMFEAIDCATGSIYSSK